MWSVVPPFCAGPSTKQSVQFVFKYLANLAWDCVEHLGRRWVCRQSPFCQEITMGYRRQTWQVVNFGEIEEVSKQSAVGILGAPEGARKSQERLYGGGKVQTGAFKLPSILYIHLPFC